MTSVVPYVLSIRALEMSDIDAIATWFGDPEDLSFFERNSPLPKGRDALRESWKEDLATGPAPAKAFWYVACDTADVPVAIGGLQTINYPSGDCVLPIFVARAMRGRGIGIRLIGLLLDFAPGTFPPIPTHPTRERGERCDEAFPSDGLRGFSNPPG